jgi:hypothetical protein
MTNPQAGEHDVDVPVTTSPQAEDHDAAAAICGEKPHTVTKQLVSRSKQPGRLKRLWRWINRQPPWWVSQILVAVLVGLLVGGLILFSGDHFNDLQARRTLQLENLRFVRDRAATNPNQPFPFSDLDLEGQDLQLLKLPHAKFNDANLSGANLDSADLTGADLSHANLRGASLWNTKLAGANLCGADLTGADLTVARLPDAILGRTNLTRATFVQAVLTGAKLTFGAFTVDEGPYGTTMEGCDVDYSHGGHPANLTETDLCSSNLAGADLKAATNLTSAKLNHIHYDEKTIWPDGFRPPKPSETLYPGYTTPFADCSKP